MASSLKFAGKNSSGNVTPISVSTEGYIQEERKFKITTTDIVREALDITSKTFYQAYDARNSGIISILAWNRTGVPLTLQFYNPTAKGNGAAVAPIYNVRGDLPVFIIPNGRPTIISAEDLPMLNNSPYINISLTPDGTPTGTSDTVIMVIDKR